MRGESCEAAEITVGRESPLEGIRHLPEDSSKVSHGLEPFNQQLLVCNQTSLNMPFSLFLERKMMLAVLHDLGEKTLPMCAVLISARRQNMILSGGGYLPPLWRTKQRSQEK